MRSIILLLLCLPLWGWSTPPYWSKTGHRVIGEVAQHHLKRKARKALAELLSGEGLAEVATYADDIKSDSTFRKFSAWHYVNFPAEAAYTEVTQSPYGDVVSGIQQCSSIHKDRNTSAADEVFYLKLLVHLVGDLHQPMHEGRVEDRGGNDIQLQWFDRGTNLHRVWDANLIDDYGMSYSELARTLPRWSRSKIREVQQGNVLEWVEEVQEITNRVYDSAEVGEKLYYRYRYIWWDTVEQQLLTGGIRLAAILNEIYG